MGDDCESGARGGCRVEPERAAPARAWAESEASESRRLLPSLHAGLALDVQALPKKVAADTFQKTKFQKRKEKLIDVLRPPYFILSMVVILVGVHWTVPASARAQLEWSRAGWRSQPWRALSYGLAHASNQHLALNALIALAVGWRLEREQGWWRVLVLWAGGLLGGAAGAALLQPSVRVVGASAAVYALLTAHLPNVCLRFGHIPLWWFRPLAVVVLVTSEWCWAAARGARAGAWPPRDHVAWGAHVMGAAVGIPLAFILFTGENSKKTYIVASRLLSAVLLVTGVALAVYYSTFGEDPDT